MLKRTLMIVTLSAAFILAFEPLQTVHGIVFSPDQLAMFGSLTNPNSPSVNNGNGFVNALKSPFKAIGRLFGRGKKNTPKLERISEKDIRKFESAPAQQTRITTNAPTYAATSSSAAAPDVNTSARDRLEKGRALLNSGDLNAAIEELSQAASLDSTLAEAQTLLGVAYESKGLHDRATHSFQAAVIADKKNPQNLNNLGFQLYRHGDYEGAAKLLKRATKLAPDDATIWNNLGLTQCQRGRFDDAVKSFVHSMGEYQGRLTVARRLQDQGYTKEAIKHLEKARELRPNSSETLSQLATLYDLSDKMEKAASARQALATLQTTDTVAARK